MTATLPPPPAVIKIKEDFSRGLDLGNPLHAKAYLKAASHFLSSWPQHWDAERLCLALIADEEDVGAMGDRGQINFWSSIIKDVHPMDDPHNFVETLIDNLAEDFIIFLIDNA